jgi:uncharacterized RDD family membrane protein YckC
MIPSTSTDGGALLRRVFAFVVDALVVLSCASILAKRLVRSRRARPAVTALLGGAGGLLYHVLLEGTWGRTVGKAAFGLVVVSADGRPCTYPAAAVRTLFRFVDWLPAGYLLGLVAIALTDRDRRLGDLAAGTVVVGGERKRG